MGVGADFVGGRGGRGLVLGFYGGNNSKMTLELKMLTNNSSTNRPSTQEYKEVMEMISELVSEHKSALVPGEPQFNMCDNAVEVSRQLKTFKLLGLRRLAFFFDL